MAGPHRITDLRGFEGPLNRGRPRERETGVTGRLNTFGPDPHHQAAALRIEKRGLSLARSSQDNCAQVHANLSERAHGLGCPFLTGL
jgi:hypothetical protein